MRKDCVGFWVYIMEQYNQNVIHDAVRTIVDVDTWEGKTGNFLFLTPVIFWTKLADYFLVLLITINNGKEKKWLCALVMLLSK